MAAYSTYTLTQALERTWHGSPGTLVVRNLDGLAGGYQVSIRYPEYQEAVQLLAAGDILRISLEHVTSYRIEAIGGSYPGSIEWVETTLALAVERPGLVDSGGLVGAQEWRWTGATWGRTPQANAWKNIAGVAITAGTPAAIWTPAAGKSVYLMGWQLSLSVAGLFIFKVNGVEVLRGGSNASATDNDSPPSMAAFPTGASNAQPLQLDVSASGTVNGFVFGYEA